MGYRVSTYVSYIFPLYYLAFNVVAEGECYFPGGTPAAGHSPCLKYDYTSLCCPYGWTCFSNQVCVMTDPSSSGSALPIGTSMRGTCTNPQWNQTACGDFCLDTSVNGNSGSLVSCGGNRWCCQPRVADSTCNCDTGKGNFLLSAGSAQTIIGAVGLDRLSTGTLTATRASTATTSSSTSKTSTSLAPSPNTLNIATSTSSRDPATATGPPNQVAVTSKVAFKAGIGAGSAVVGLILAFVAFCWGKKRRDRKQQGGTSPIAMVPSQEFMGAVHQEPLPRPPMHDPYNPMNSVLLLDKDDAPPRYNTRSAYGNRPYPDPYQPESGI